MVLLEEVETALSEEVAAAAVVEVEVEVEVKRVGTMNHFSPGNHFSLLFFFSLFVSPYTTPNLCLSLFQKFELKSVNI